MNETNKEKSNINWSAEEWESEDDSDQYRVNSAAETIRKINKGLKAQWWETLLCSGRFIGNTQFLTLQFYLSNLELKFQELEMK